MPLRLEHVEVGSRVSYEDMANPRREGTVTEILMDGREFRVAWDATDDDPCLACGAYGGHDGGCTIGETVSDLRQHGWHLLANLPGSVFDGADVIAAYTRGDAIRDGVLVPTTDLTPDEPLFARQAGWTVPVCLTTAVANLVIPTEREAREYGQDVKGRLWDVLSMGRLYARRTAASEAAFPCIFQLAGPDRERWTKRAASKTIGLKVVIGPDDDGDPVMTVMLRGED